MVAINTRVTSNLPCITSQTNSTNEKSIPHKHRKVSQRLSKASIPSRNTNPSPKSSLKPFHQRAYSSKFASIANDPRCNNEISRTGRRSQRSSGNDSKPEKHSGEEGQKETRGTRGKAERGEEVAQVNRSVGARNTRLSSALKLRERSGYAFSIFAQDSTLWRIHAHIRLRCIHGYKNGRLCGHTKRQRNRVTEMHRIS